ncbi:hypothetical protein F503_04833 [Ophiostoma piceae UAMH 11346]|uniref:Uncharacterized protein n=1 Tax=Ophiostoma piceae (strain UAMH 11346) TaxID=1262450 RepID=S3CTF8_OPHP1|nr:hypothetical protein F503_04833 [Ophiostoma piceae UAMH 11346]
MSSTPAWSNSWQRLLKASTSDNTEDMAMWCALYKYAGFDATLKDTNGHVKVDGQQSEERKTTGTMSETAGLGRRRPLEDLGGGKAVGNPSGDLRLVHC